MVLNCGVLTWENIHLLLTNPKGSIQNIYKVWWMYQYHIKIVSRRWIYIYSLERRRERYLIIYIWKILENIVPKFSDPIGHYVSERRGRYYITSHIELRCLDSLQSKSFRFKESRLFNSLPKFIRNASSCTIIVFKSRLDNFLSDVPDDPVQTKWPAKATIWYNCLVQRVEANWLANNRSNNQ